MDRPAAIDLIRSSSLGTHADALIAALRPSVRLRSTRDPGARAAPVSRFVGQPLLPRGMAWPTWNSSSYHDWWIAWTNERLASPKGASRAALEGIIEQHRVAAEKNPTPLNFLAQIRLDELGAAAHLVGLPASGTLSFFYDVETSAAAFVPQSRGSSRVLLLDDVDLVPVEPPTENEFSPCGLANELEYTLPRDLSPDAAQGAPEIDKEAYGALVETLRGKAPFHRLGGHPEEVQHGLFRTCQLASNGMPSGSPKDTRNERAQELAKGAHEWRLLLQIDTDERGPGWMWGDVGTLYFCIREEDLRARRFDRIWCEEQCC